MKLIKRRIASVSGTQKLMRAMDLAAASRFHRAKARLEHIRPLYESIREIMAGVHPEDERFDGPYAARDKVRNIAYVVITGDRGLCGGYNVNVSREALALMDANPGSEEHIITVGTKGWEFFRRRHRKVALRIRNASEDAFYEEAEQIGSMLSRMYRSEEIDEAYLIYTHFESVLSHSPRIFRLLPVGADDFERKAHHEHMIYEPGAEDFMEYAVPLYLDVSIYGAMVESAVCEHAARMTSMDAAARNAGEIIDSLTMDYNRKRQGLITQEISEIVGGANALK